LARAPSDPLVANLETGGGDPKLPSGRLYGHPIVAIGTVAK
jgi:hypothetical protein